MTDKTYKLAALVRLLARQASHRLNQRTIIEPTIRYDGFLRRATQREEERSGDPYAATRV
jgi:hypothetical protein